MNHIETRIHNELQELERSGGLRKLPDIIHDGKFVTIKDGKYSSPMLNLSSNDYLGIASEKEIQEDFLTKCRIEDIPFTSSSSRLLSGNYQIYQETENLIAKKFERESSLLFGSGYQMNTGILPAVTDKNTLVLADKLVHASIIDGIRLTGSQCIRFRHQDYEQLEMLVKKYYNSYSSIIIVTESIFSMDGDVADLKLLSEIKRKYPIVMLYVDEAHGIGVRGEKGLGVAEEQGCINNIDFLCGTLGKALASAGAYVVCSSDVRKYLINKMRPFIFTTALPPVNIAWTRYIFSRLEEWNDRRKHLSLISRMVKDKIMSMGIDCISDSHIIPFMLGSNEKAIAASELMQKEGYYVLPIRQPTVPAGSERLRFSLTAAVTEDEINRLNEKIEIIIQSI
ncbi:8-amino-7-oxononanoate synthase [uncultured Bacteroides sp.]|uniref:aminotransferase class I/II-fold pyridoxal phosphate-dependent enzyme n=1 Tax=uncultured Bacteroides sp. TaxID=162156 RepID=UPI002636D9A6|nr:8-amino-7-oxononanoate synthase [uncultured Bacteroides sp.]